MRGDVAILLVAGVAGACGQSPAAADAAFADAAAADAGGVALDAAVDEDAASRLVDVATDAGGLDLVVADTRVAFVPLVPPPDGGAGWRLSQTGLYRDLASGVMAPEVLEFEPAYPLWSDASDKRRWLALPAGAVIDTSDMDAWRLPEGTRVWKEFSRGGRRLETRLILRTGPGAMDYWMGAFIWLPDGSDAIFAPEGQRDVLGTDHDVPTAKACWSCHQSEPGRALGLSAIQLSKVGESRGLTLDALARAGLLSHPPAPGTSHAPPGPPLVRAALGYLHANCGHCHNDRGVARPETDHILRLAVGEATPEATAIYRTSLGVKLQKLSASAGLVHRVVPGDPSASALLRRMATREKDLQMPPIATERVDDGAVDLVTRWIASLPAR